MTNRRQIRVLEHQGVVVELDDARVPDLVQTCGQALTVAPTTERHRYEIRANSLVGVVANEDVEILIRPKVPLRNVFLLLEPSQVSVELRAERVGFGTDDDLVPAFAAFYARLLEQTLRRGLRRDYRPKADALVSLRGRIDLNRQVRRAVPTPLDCTFDEYTEDTLLNRALKAAALRLHRLRSIGEKNRDALRHLLTWFGEVDDRAPSIQSLRKHRFSRLDAHYEPAVRLAALVLEGSSIRDELGATLGNSFLVDMKRVFESFLETRLRDALAPQLRVKGQDRLHLDRHRRVRMRPDLVFYDEDRRPVYVGDAKYKVTSDLLGRDSDLYQLLAYTTALGVSEGVLIYALTDGTDDDFGEIDVNRADKRLVVRRIDLRGGRAELDGSVAELAQWIRSRTPRLSAVGA